MTRSLFICIMAMMMASMYSFSASAGVTGRLKGKVIDKDSQQPLPGAAVKIEGTYFETTSNSDGEFSFIGVDAGTYDISVKLETYADFMAVRTTLAADRVTEMIVEMIPASAAGSEVITGYSNSSSQTGSYQTLIIRRDEFVKQPYRNINDITSNSTAAIYQRNETQYVRAGAPGEMGYYLNGVLLNDGFTGKVYARLPYGAVDHIAVNVGGFESKYGNFGSGITQIIPKRGGDTFQSSAEYVTDAGASVIGSESYGRNIYSLTFSGPIIKKTLHFFAAAELSKTNDANPGVFGYPLLHYSNAGARNPDPVVNDTVIFATDVNGNIKYKKGPRPGRVNADQSTNLYGNIFYEPYSSVEVDATALYSFSKRNIFQPSYLLMTGREPHSERSTLWTNISGKYKLSSEMFIQGSFGFYSTGNEIIQRDQFNKGTDAALILNQYTRGNTGSTTYYGDNVIRDINRGSLAFQKSESQAWSAGLELNWKPDEHNFVQTGLHSTFHTIRFFDLLDVGYPNGGANNYYGYRIVATSETFSLKDQNSDDFVNGIDGAKKPVVSYFFVQDEYTQEHFRINGGIRFDQFNTGTKKLKDILNPTGSNQILGPEDFTKAKSDIRFSPRIAGSVEAVNGLTLRASYGWFYQLPAFAKYYVGSDFLERQSLAPPFSVTIGNSTLKMQKSELFELGFSYNDHNRLLATGSIYRKNIHNFIRSGIVASTPNGLLINGNVDHAFVSGIEFSLEGNPYDNFSPGLAISYLDAKMNGSGTNSGFRAAWLGQSDVKFDAPLDYEQETTIRIHALCQLHKGEGPLVSGAHPFENISFYAIGNWQSGFPYTPVQITRYALAGVPSANVVGRRNSKNLPSTFSVDVKASKKFDVTQKFHASVYIEVLNLFDQKNVVDVFYATGKPTDDGFLEVGGSSLSTRELQQYQYVLKDNFHYLNPRLVNMGLTLDF